ncbi:KPN_02809 family neutral zinc metallopeptidase [Nocardioides sambongensis]|uniref:KPN_02809 family neutral zinc metallopeptidase n=1 Tax=Nocardioides sambongensis TaxID=2589074 RepID=UPI00112BAE49|nr:neutral zinc metallopeptidase [Nocardioides sambongensis]
MVRFNPKARLDTSRIRDVGRRGGSAGAGRSAGSGARRPVPGGVAVGGVGAVVVAVLLYVVLQAIGGDGDTDSGPLSATRVSDAQQGTDRYAGCETGADANESHDCARVAVENSLTDYWADALGASFRPIDALVTFTGQVATACGTATSAVGPFYCPADESIYLDTTFFDEVLERELGGPDGDFVEWYVLAHEYGHHISNLIGDMARVRDQQTGPQSLGVRLELQADCFAGAWTANADGSTDAAGEPLFAEPVSAEEVQLAQDAAAAVGDDAIQRRTQGQVTEESWTHGSSEQRARWFQEGYRTGSPESCDTFDVPRV